MMNEDDLANFLVELADLAAAQTLPRFRNLSAVDNKIDSGFDPVTEADREAERVIRERIMERYPQHGIEGEEFGMHQADAPWRWVIDPVDGTRAFVAGIPVWGTLIALCHNLVPVAGIMSQPFCGEYFVSCNGRSRYHRASRISDLRTSGKTELASAILMSTAPEIFDEGEAVLFNRLSGQCRMTRFGTDCYAYCMLAAGQIELVVESGLSFYDIAALIPIIENAGGVVTDWKGQAISPPARVLAAANPELHERALEVLARA